MNLNKILTIVFFLVAVGIGYYLFSSVRYDINEEQRIARIESRVIEKLQMLRDAQIAYRSVHGQYTSEEDKLKEFIRDGNLYITQRKETVITLDYGADSVVVQVDTLGTVAVRDSLFNERRYPNFDLERLMIIPGSEGKKFEMFADKVIKGGLKVDVFEVRDVAPINPRRQAKDNARALRVGSRTDVTTAGNWE